MEPSSSHVRLLLFAAYREIVGTRELAVDVPEGASVADLFEIVGAEYPRLRQLRPSTAFAVNRTVVDGAHRLRDGDEVAFLQPVSGGGL